MAISKQQPMRPALNDCIDAINALMESANIQDIDILRTLSKIDDNDTEQNIPEEK
jgi:hypothetical protein